MVTEYDADLDVYYERFRQDKARAEAEDRLYYYREMRQDNVDVSVTPLTTFQTLAVSVPPAFYQKDPDHMRYTPFTTVGALQSSAAWGVFMRRTAGFSCRLL